jgi:hypothetical protein
MLEINFVTIYMMVLFPNVFLELQTAVLHLMSGSTGQAGRQTDGHTDSYFWNVTLQAVKESVRIQSVRWTSHCVIKCY